MKLLLACSAGMSTSLLEKSVNDYVKENKLDIHCDSLPTFDARGKISQYDVILLGPQVAYELPAFKKAAGSIPVAVIPGDVYAMAKGKETIQIALGLFKK